MNTVIEQDIWETLLAPISEDKPTGTDTREDISPTSLYQTIRDARAVARNNERSNLAVGEINYFSLPDWAIIAEQAPILLAEQSKDLEIVAWYIEALTRLHGFAGIATGFSLARELIAQFGSNLYPVIDEDGIASQLASLSGLNGFGAEGTLVGPIKSIAITQGEPPGPLATWQCEQAFEIARINDEDRREARLRQGGVAKEEMDRVVSETSSVFFEKLVSDLSMAIDSYAQYQAVLDAYAESDPQPTAKIKSTLEECKQNLVYLIGDKFTQASTEEQEEPEQSPQDQTTPKQENKISKSINSRDDAIKQLHVIANFFKKTEPHSPISYSIEQVIRWSSLPLVDLINELIPDESARSKFKHLSGISQE